jgi:hypothetical protein
MDGSKLDSYESHTYTRSGPDAPAPTNVPLYGVVGRAVKRTPPRVRYHRHISLEYLSKHNRQRLFRRKKFRPQRSLSVLTRGSQASHEAALAAHSDSCPLPSRPSNLISVLDECLVDLSNEILPVSTLLPQVRDIEYLLQSQWRNAIEVRLTENVLWSARRCVLYLSKQRFRYG